MDRLCLNGDWDLKGISPEGEITDLKAVVPGSALNDVLNSYSETEDVFYRDNADKVQKYENYDWIYTKTFVCDKKECKYTLHFDKLDTYCDVYVNGQKIAECQNGFISYDFDITDALTDGDNELQIKFRSPVQETKDREKRSFSAFSRDRLHTRRMQCSYGWDWTARFVTCGIGDAYIVAEAESMKVDNVYVYTTYIDDESAEIRIDAEFKDYNFPAVVDYTVYDQSGAIAGKHSRYNAESFMRVVIDIEDAKLWYPNGYGEQNLYKLVIGIEGKELYSDIFGIRTAKISQIKDKKGSPNYNLCKELQQTEFGQRLDFNEEFSGFTLKINGKKIICKGGNWVPCEPFDGKNTDEKITRLLELARDAGINMLRIWGGGKFETEHFYNECSRLGILISQDLLMACGDYPDEQEWFLEELKKEATYAARLIRNKPCLVWWCGDNENGTWGTNILDRYHGRDAAYKATAPVIYKEDFTREFFATSPFGGNKYSSNTTGICHNTLHLPVIFNYIENTDMSDFKEWYKIFRGRFIGEEAVMGAVSETSLKKFMTDEDIYGDDMSMWLYHTKNNTSLDRELFDYNKEMSEKLFGDFKDGKDRVFKLKYVQYEWMRVSMEQIRREREFSSGVLYWMYNDCWPAADTWSMVDYYCLPTAAYYSFKRAAKLIIGSIDYVDGKYRLCICNDGDERLVKVECFTSNNRKILSEEVLCAKESVTVAKELSLELSENELLILELETADGKDRSFYKKGKLIINPAEIELVSKDENSITVSAKEYVHAVELEGEAVFEDNYFSLMPGETRTISFDGSGDITICGYTI